MSGLRLDKPWLPLVADVIAALPAQLGVYEIGDANGTVVKIGYAGGRERFGMRTALTAEIDQPDAIQFHFEFTHAYLTRWEELLMVHVAEHGDIPTGNVELDRPRGRLDL
jgi:hypothetical protein